MKLQEDIQRIKQMMGLNDIIYDTIIKMVNDWLEEYGIDACDINKGECFVFADNLANKLSKYGIKDVEILTTDLFHDTATEYSKDDDEIWYNPEDYNSYKPNNFKWLKNGYHAWVYVNGRHYDSDAPKGVINFYDLPIFKK